MRLRIPLIVVQPKAVNHNMKNKFFICSFCMLTALATVEQSLAMQPLHTDEGIANVVTKLIPQQEGTPLPLRDITIAETWRPEMKALIDNMLILFKDRENPPSPEEIESKLNIKLVDTLQLNPQMVGYYQLGPSNLKKHFTVTQAPYLIQPARGNGYVRKWNQAYYIYRSSSDTPKDQRRDTHILSLPMSRYPDVCLNPYELAVYLGDPFENGEAPPLDAPPAKQWGWAYVWGMFSWGKAGTYVSKRGVSITVRSNRDLTSDRISQPECIFSLEVTGYFKPQE